jgi:hypothetical protein
MFNNLKTKKMKEFLLIFRNDGMNGGINARKPTQEQIEANEKQWGDWMGGIAAKGKFVGGLRPGSEGKTVKSGNVITDGPYAEVKEILVGTAIVKADSIDGAVEFAKGCPVLMSGGNVEVRDLIPSTM